MERSKNLDDYEVDEDRTVLICKTCGTEQPLWVCSCGKVGTKDLMIDHLEDRYSKGTQSAFVAHRLAEPALATLKRQQEDEGWKYAEGDVWDKIYSNHVDIVPLPKNVPSEDPTPKPKSKGGRPKKKK